jgi:hypothetical protein
MLLVAATTIIHVTSGGSSGWVTAAAAVGGALVGGLATGAVQYVVEKQRSAHEERLEAERSDRRTREPRSSRTLNYRRRSDSCSPICAGKSSSSGPL